VGGSLSIGWLNSSNVVRCVSLDERCVEACVRKSTQTIRSCEVGELGRSIATSPVVRWVL
jgi:hypothetical protein